MQRPWKFIVTAALLIAAVGGAIMVYPLLTGAVVGLQAGMCENVVPDPVTGQQLVYCCLDEIFVFQERGLTGEFEEFMDALEAASTLTTEQGEAFFNTPYTSTIHRQYEWNSICGARISCEYCIFGPQCGNKVVQSGEECDDGNLMAGDGCDHECQLEGEVAPTCGNAVREGNEQCDDGNAQDNDGCNANCERVVAPLPVAAQCGNATVETGEQCDDGNRAVGDGCDANCQVEQQAPVCGNGVREGSEECDDGNTNTGDGCDARCEREIAPQITNLCGNSIVESGEQCDDGNRAAGDGCSPGCKTEAPIEPHPATESGALVETGVVLPEPVVEPEPEPVVTEPEIPLSCGNGIIEPPEECDDTNNSAGDGCSPVCVVEPGGGRSCGNKVLNRGEQCDDGNIADGDDCSASCQLLTQGPLSCGDDLVTAGEQCDDGNMNDNDGCSRLCRIESWMTMGNPNCGNRTVDSGEECDDGNTQDRDGCSDTCFWEFGALGDGIVQHALGEQCEPAISTVPCDANGRFILPNCGDGFLNVREECDQGEENSYSPAAICRPDCSRGGCGDSIVDPDEGCDDGNRVNGDGCSRECKTEQIGAGGTVSHQPPPPPGTFIDPLQAQILQAQRRNALQETGPAAIIFAAGGAAAGLGWVRRKRA
jgi:cysteine-rich repeat protein